MSKNPLIRDKENVLRAIDELRRDIVNEKWTQLALVAIGEDYKTGVNLVIGNAYGAASMINVITQNIQCRCGKPMCDTVLFKVIMETVSVKFINDESLGQMVVSGFTAPATPQTKN